MQKTTDVLASSPQDLRQLEDLRLTLLGKARPAQSRQPRASMAVHDVSGARPSMLLSRLNSAAQTGGTGTTGEGQGDSDGADGEDEDEGLSLEKIAGVVDGPGGGVLRKLNEMAGVGPG